MGMITARALCQAALEITQRSRRDLRYNLKQVNDETNWPFWKKVL